MKDIELAERYLLGKLSSVEAEQVKTRLANDPPFRAIMDELRKVIDVLQRKWIRSQVKAVGRQMLYRKLAYIGVVVIVVLIAALLALKVLMSQAASAEIHKDTDQSIKEAVITETRNEHNESHGNIVTTYSSGNRLFNTYKAQPAVDKLLRDTLILNDTVQAVGPKLRSQELPLVYKPQLFEFDNTRDTVIHCMNGTLLTFKANSLETKNGESGLKQVRLSVTEFTNYHDMWLHKVTTCSDGKLLESGGSCLIEARNATGQEVVVGQGQEFNLQFPSTYQPSMTTFYGQRDSARELNWKLPQRSRIIPVKGYSVHAEKVSKRKWIGKNRMDYDTLSGITELPVRTYWQPASDTTYYLEPIVSLQGYYPEKNQPYENVHVADETALKSVFDTLVATSSSEAKDLLLSRKSILIRFGVDEHGKITKYDYNFVLPKKLERQFKERAQYIVNNQSIDMKGLDFTSAILNVTLKPLFKVTKGEAEAFNDSNLNKVSNVNDRKKMYNAIVSSTFGYINCDRFFSEPDKADIKVFIEGRNADVRVFFRDINAVVRCEYAGGRAIFRNAKADAAIMVLATVMTKDGLMMKIQEGRVGENIVIKDLEPFDLVAVKQKLLSYSSSL